LRLASKIPEGEKQQNGIRGGKNEKRRKRSVLRGKRAERREKKIAREVQIEQEESEGSVGVKGRRIQSADQVRKGSGTENYGAADRREGVQRLGKQPEATRKKEKVPTSRRTKVSPGEDKKGRWGVLKKS